MTDASAHRPRLDALQAHLGAFLGAATGRASVETRSGALELLRFEPMPGALVLATCGASPEREALLTLFSDPPEPVLGAACAALAAYAEALSDRTAPVHGFCPPPDVLEGFELDALLTLPPTAFDPALAEAKMEGGPPVRFDWLVPGYEEELEYLRAHGPQALSHLFRAQRLDPQDFLRGPASTLVDPEDAARMAGAATEDDEERGYRVEQVRGGVRIERRRRKIGQASKPSPRRPPAEEAEPEPAPPPASSPRRAPPPRPRDARERDRPDRVRFDLGPEAHPASPEPEPEPPPPEPTLDPAEAKRRRIEELKEKALAARERAEARRRGETVDLPPAPAPPERPPKPSPERNRAVLAAERRRGRLNRRDGSDGAK